MALDYSRIVQSGLDADLIFGQQSKSEAKCCARFSHCSNASLSKSGLRVIFVI